MTSIYKNLQHTLSHYNGIITKSLTLPKEFSKMNNEKDILIKYFQNKDKQFMRSTTPLHPNIIQYLKDNSVIDTIFKTPKKSFIQSEINKINIPIMNQYSFSYDLLEILYNNKSIKKKYFDNKYIDNNFMSIESTQERFNCSKYRIDIKFTFENNISFGVEYLEEHHMYDYEYQIRRAAELRMKYNIKKWIFVWQKKYLSDDDYKKSVFKEIIRTIKKLEIINDEETYIINELNKYIYNKSFSKILYTAFTNENIPILSKNDIIELLDIKKSRVTSLFDKVHKQIDKINVQEIDIEFSDEEESEIEDIDNDIYYEEKDDNTYYSNHGLFVILNKVSEKDFTSQDKYIFCLKLQNKIAKCAFESIKKIRKMELDIDKQFMWGYD